MSDTHRQAKQPLIILRTQKINGYLKLASSNSYFNYLIPDVFIVCVCVCVFIKLHITAQSGPVILVILCHSR